MLSNYLFSALAGTTWYFQFFFYTMGETQMGKFGFASWTLHMASIIIFSTMWGWILPRMEGVQQEGARPDRRRHRHADPLDHRHRVRHLSEEQGHRRPVEELPEAHV